MIKLLSKNILLIALLLSTVYTYGQRKQRLADKDTKQWHYDIECVNTAKQGFKLVKVWSYSKKPKYAVSQSFKNAVHGIIFKGFTEQGRSCTAFRALMNKPMTEKEYNAFFKDFFLDSGEYNLYVTDAENGAIVPEDIQKVDKKMYKIGVVVSINTDALRKRLEDEGIITGLTTGF
ncbi:MAG: hypothetical protein NWQ38_15270 [Cellulophaga sp.]|nr:hypothetical protein [Cellulophaga sp.]